MPERIDHCRLCGCSGLETVLDLGEQFLTGVFPEAGQPDPTSGPLQLGLCEDCGLVQLLHVYDAEEMYGGEYGYRSGLNASMVDHLHRKAQRLEREAGLEGGDVVLDIGANDATLLKGYETPGLRRVGIDPTIPRWRDHYPDDIQAIPDFFTAERFRGAVGPPARLITSVAMFYDLPDPVGFARDVEACLAPDGLWHFEQSYLPSMLRALSYDTVCHEHVEYYSLQVVEHILREAGLEVVDVGFNRVNGGSFAVSAQRAGGPRARDSELIQWFLRQEAQLRVAAPETFATFRKRVEQHAADLRDLISTLRSSGRRLAGYGASTKGNVLLQYCGFSRDDLPVIAEVNPAKFGCETPGTRVPIEAESAVHGSDPEYLVVLPWHFREGIIAREADYLRRGGRLVFPLPEIEVLGD